MKKKLFQCAILVHTETEDGVLTSMIGDMFSILASDKDDAKMQAQLSVPDETNSSEIEILIKEF